MPYSIQSVELKDKLRTAYPWTAAPLVVSAPMRVMSGPELAVAISRAGGLGFIGPGEKPQSTAADLEAAKALLKSAGNEIPLRHDQPLLPVGVGFQMWNGDLVAASSAVRDYQPAAAWIFAPRDGQEETNAWMGALRKACPGTQIWLQVGSLSEALEAARAVSPPDVLVIQGAEAGGHGRASGGAGFITLLPEIADAIGGSGIPLIAAGGIADGRGVAAALGLGAAGTAMGTRFLASREARIKKGYQDEVVRATDGATNTVRTQLYNHLRGTFGWPEHYSPRTIINKSWEEHQTGVSFDELKSRHDKVAAEGDKAWGPDGRTATYAGANVGLVKSIEDAAAIVEQVRDDAVSIIRSLQDISRP